MFAVGLDLQSASARRDGTSGRLSKRNLDPDAVHGREFECVDTAFSQAGTSGRESDGSDDRSARFKSVSKAPQDSGSQTTCVIERLPNARPRRAAVGSRTDHRCILKRTRIDLLSNLKESFQ